MKKFSKIFMLALAFVCAFALVACAKVELTVNTTTASIYASETATIDYTCSSKKVTFTSSDANVATAADGVITGVSAGSATITVKAGKLTSDIAVTVKAVELAVAESDIKVCVDKTVNLTATTKYGTIAYASSDASVATVDANGAVKGLKAGTTTVTVSVANESKTVNVTVIDAPNIALAETTKTIKYGETYKPVVVAEAGQELVWTVANSKVASVAEDGTVTGLAQGNTTLTVSYKAYPDQKATMTIRVTYVSVSEIIVDETSIPATIKVGDSFTLKAAVDPEDASRPGLIFSTDDANISVTEDGVVTALAKGSAIVIITSEEDEEMYIEQELNIEYADATGVTVSGDTEMKSTDIDADAKTLTATVAPAGADPKVTWSSSDESIAIIDENGVITPLTFGTVTFTATASDGTTKGEITVTITDNYPYQKSTILVDATYVDGTVFYDGEVAYKVGVNAFANIKDALAALDPAEGEEAIVKVAAGTYADDLTITKSVKLLGCFANNSESESASVITGAVKVKANDVQINGFEFTGNAQINADDMQNFKFCYNVAYGSTLAASTFSEARPSDFSTLNAFLSVVSASQSTAGGPTIAYNKFDISNYVVSIARYEDITITGNSFYNFDYNAVRIDGGYNGAVTITDNEFTNDTLKGLVGIFFRSYGDDATLAKQVITIKNNTFTNIGAVGTTGASTSYLGAIAARNYQETGVEINISYNTFTTCTNYIQFRNQCDTPSNIDTYGYTMAIDHNCFFGVPSGVYYTCRISSSDSATNCIACATMDSNFFGEWDGKACTPDSSKLIGLKSEPTNTFNSVRAKFADEHNLPSDDIIVVSPSFANVAAEGEISFSGLTLVKGYTAFDTYAAAEEYLKTLEYGIPVVYLASGNIDEAITVTLDGVGIFGANAGIDPTEAKEDGDDPWEDATVLLQPLTINANNVCIDGLAFKNLDTVQSIVIGLADHTETTGEGEAAVTETVIANVTNVYISNILISSECKANSAVDSTAAPIMFNGVAKDVTFEYVHIEQRTGRQMVVLQAANSEITNLSFLNCYFPGSTGAYYNDAFKMQGKLGGDIVFFQNYIANYGQYIIWVYATCADCDFVIVDNTIEHCSDGPNGGGSGYNHGVITLKADVTNTCNVIIEYNKCTDCEFLIDYRATQATVNSTIMYNSWTEGNDSAAGGFLRNQSTNTVNAQYNYLDKEYTNEGATVSDSYATQEEYEAATSDDSKIWAVVVPYIK